MIAFSRLRAAVAATWPAARTERIGSFIYRDGAGGGNRVSACTLDGDFDVGAFGLVEQRFASDMREPLFQLWDQAAFDAVLDAKGYLTRDETTVCLAPLETLAAEPALSVYPSWPPLAIQRDIWAQGGIKSERIAVMERCEGARTTLIGRIGDVPLATAFIACYDRIVMVHALEIAPEGRRRGLGRAVMQRAAQWGVDLGAQDLAVLVTRTNTGARDFYQALGMKEIAAYHYRYKPVT